MPEGAGKPLHTFLPCFWKCVALFKVLQLGVASPGVQPSVPDIHAVPPGGWNGARCSRSARDSGLEHT